MLKKLSLFVFTLLAGITCNLSALNYDLLDIGTLHTKKSVPIALNNGGQILGTYEVPKEGLHTFVRDVDGTFYELPLKEYTTGWNISWRFLCDDGKAYGVFENGNSPYLYVWDSKSGVTKLGALPGKDIVTIKNNGLVLIKQIQENENGKIVKRPVIWQNGKITRLNGLEGDLGLPAEESLALDMNNKGEVVGQSLVYLVYKNEVYKQYHAAKWGAGQTASVDLHKTIPKSTYSEVLAINDNGDCLIRGYGLTYVVCKDGEINQFSSNWEKMNNKYLMYNDWSVIDKKGSYIFQQGDISQALQDHNSIWFKFKKLLCVNEKGEILAQGETIFGEDHIMLIVPSKSQKKELSE